MRSRPSWVYMVGPDLQAKGGIASVCAAYREAGLFERLRLRYLPSYVSGSAGAKLAVALRSALHLLAALLRGRVALLHVHMASGSSVWRKLGFCGLARAFGVPYVLHLHSGLLAGYFDEGCGPLRQSLIRRGLGAACAVLVLARQRQEWMHLRGLDRVPPQLLPNLAPCPPCVESTQRTEGEQLLFLGRLEEAKGLSTLILAFALLHRKRPQARLLLGGEGDAARYAAQAAALGLPEGAVRFLGWVDAKAKPALWRQAALFVLPSRFEGQPMGLLEAMGQGLASVATAVGGVPDVMQDGVQGRLVPVDDVAALAAALEALLADPAARQRMGAAARQTVQQRFSAEAVERQLHALYARCALSGWIGRQRC